MSQNGRIVRMQRTETFSASHRLNNSEESQEWNLNIYQKCNNPNGHGHNYSWQVVLEGPVDPKTGMVYNLSDLKAEMNMILEKVDHKNLDKDVDYFRDSKIVSTTENLAIYLFDELKSIMKSPELLKEVIVHETAKNCFTYSGN